MPSGILRQAILLCSVAAFAPLVFAAPAKPDFSVRPSGYKPVEAAAEPAASPVEDAPAASPQAMTPFDFTSRFTVKVANVVADMFEGKKGGGHGTGFFIGIKKMKDGKVVAPDQDGEPYGIVFTNNHVITMNKNQVQRLSIGFSTDNEIAEEVPAELEYSSPIHDFAVLLFKMSDVKRVRDRIRPAPLPPKGSLLYEFAKYGRQLQGRRTLAQGNPYDSEASITFGNISTVYRDQNQGVFIQTQTPINPGNSGGPLLDLEEQVVIGINTQKITDADNIGFSIPIGVVLDEYSLWVTNPSVGREKEIDLRIASNSKQQLDVLGVTSVVEAKYPDFFNSYDEVIIVEDAAPDSGLKRGDQIIKVNGEFLASSLLFYEWKRHRQHADKKLPLEVVRNGKLIKVAANVRDGEYTSARTEVDYVYVSGIVFRLTTENLRWRMAHDFVSRVIVGQILTTTETNFGAARMPDPGSILVAVNVNNVDYEIRNLAQLRQILYKNKSAKFIRLDVREPVMVASEGGRGFVTDYITGAFAYRSTTATYVLPMTEFFGPMQFSFNQFREQYSFKQGAPETREWRSKVDQTRQPTECEQVVAAVKPKVSRRKTEPAPIEKPPVDKVSPDKTANNERDAQGRPLRLPPMK